MFLKQLKLFLLMMLLLGVIVLLLACGSSPMSPESSITATTSTSGTSFSQDIQSIFNLNCVVCHQGVSPSGGLNLKENLAYQKLVNIDSIQSSLLLVSPGNSEESYLWHKLNGTHRDVGGSGVRMPYNLPQLPQDKLDLVKKWINEGAQGN